MNPPPPSAGPNSTEAAFESNRQTPGYYCTRMKAVTAQRIVIVLHRHSTQDKHGQANKTTVVQYHIILAKVTTISACANSGG